MNTTPEKIVITADLTPEQALAFAQFLKRACFANYQDHAVDRDEAYTMIDAGEVLRASLASAGFAPR